MEKFTPAEVVDGIPIYAPELLRESDSFVSGAHGKLDKYERYYFWFSERRNLIYYLIGKYFSNALLYCEIGCGGGYILSQVRSIIPKASLFGTEIFLEGLKIAKKNQPDATLFQSDVLSFPCHEEFDLIGMYDVLEHLDDDETALKSVFDALIPGGGAIVTVPQHKWLWTENDVYSCHKLRYARKELVEKCCNAGFEVVRATSYTSLLLPAFVLNVALNRKGKMETAAIAKQFEIPAFLNFIFKVICKIELLLTKVGVNFLFGGSLVCIIRKPRNENSI